MPLCLFSKNAMMVISKNKGEAMIKIILILVFSISISNGNIMDKCKIKWGTDYRMVKHCVSKQTEAKQRLHSLPNNEIMSACKVKWGTDYRMVKYCVEKQSEAKRSLGL